MPRLNLPPRLSLGEKILGWFELALLMREREMLALRAENRVLKKRLKDRRKRARRKARRHTLGLSS